MIIRCTNFSSRQSMTEISSAISTFRKWRNRYGSGFLNMKISQKISQRSCARSGLGKSKKIPIFATIRRRFPTTSHLILCRHPLARQVLIVFRQPQAECSKNSKFAGRSKMVRCKEAKKSRTRGHAQIRGLDFSLTQQIAILGRAVSFFSCTPC